MPERYPSHWLARLLILIGTAMSSSVTLPAGDLPDRDLLLHLRADTGLELNAEGDVLSWRDQSPNGFLLRPPTGADQSPRVEDRADPVIRFGGRTLLQTERMVRLFKDVSAPLTVLMVVRSSSRSSGQKLLLSEATDGPRFGLGYDLGGTLTGGGLGVLRGVHHASVAFGTQLLSELAVFTVAIGPDGTAPHNLRVWRNGVRRYVTLEGSGWWQPGDYPSRPARLQMGGETRPSSPNPTSGHRGDIAEVVIYQRLLDAGERSRIEARLGERHTIAAYASAGRSLSFQTRQRVPDHSGEARVQTRTTRWDPSKTAAVVVDMWDDHHCVSAAERVGEMAPAMDRLLQRLRRQGVLVIHSPSDTTDFYADSPARKRATQSPFRAAPVTFQWNDPNLKCEAIPDIQAGCSCDTQEVCSPSYRAWKSQHPALRIGRRDVISDDGQEIYNVLEEHGIDNVLVMGVHTNVCVLGRPFGIRQMHYLGKNVVLVRDLTDTYHRDPGFHFEGISKTVRHIETFWAPTTTSASLVGTPEFRFAQDKRPHIVFVIGEAEYETERTLPAFAASELEPRGVRVSYVVADKERIHEFPGMDLVSDADLLFLSVRRRHPPEQDLDLVRKHLDDGRPLVGIRTSSHAFGLRRGEATPEGHASWDTFGHDVLGCTYAGHHGGESARAGKCYFEIDSGAASHPILEGVSPSRQVTYAWLYRSKPLMRTATAVAYGGIQGLDDVEPVAWTNLYKDSRIFYTSLGHPKDFENATFRRLLVNGIFWALGQETPPVRAERTHGRTSAR